MKEQILERKKSKFIEKFKKDLSDKYSAISTLFPNRKEWLFYVDGKAKSGAASLHLDGSSDITKVNFYKTESGFTSEIFFHGGFEGFKSKSLGQLLIKMRNFLQKR